MLDELKRLAFSSDYRSGLYLQSLPRESAEKLKKEIAACDCRTCKDEECRFRFDDKRIPADAGGESQCLRWAKEKTPFSWRNGNGMVIVIPDEVIQAIVK